jgi:hypothetical protein
MGCGCHPDVRGMLDAALFDPDELSRVIAELNGDVASITVLDPAPRLPFRADIEAAIEAGRLTRIDSAGQGTLAVYLDEDRRIIHVGLTDDDGMVTSRWAGGLTCRHALFDLPRSHGEMVHFYAPA